MGGNHMSVLQAPIEVGDTEELRRVLDEYKRAVPLLLQKQFIPDNGCIDMDPVFITPLRYCIRCNEPECLRILLEIGGDPNERDSGGATLLYRACKKPSVECVKVLLECGARVYDCDEWGVYPIHACVSKYGDTKDSRTILDLLLNAGNPDDTNLKDDEYEKRPLHYASFYGNISMCKYLLELGADINAKDRHGRTAYQSCESRQKIRDFLKEQGCEVPPPDPNRPSIFPLFKPNNAVRASTASTNIVNDVSGNETSVSHTSPSLQTEETTTVEINHEADGGIETTPLTQTDDNETIPPLVDNPSLPRENSPIS